MKSFSLIYFDYCLSGVQTKLVDAKELALFIIEEAYNTDIDIISIKEIATLC